MLSQELEFSLNSAFRDARGRSHEYITVEHLLTMTSGLEWPEWSADYSSLANSAKYCIKVSELFIF